MKPLQYFAFMMLVCLPGLAQALVFEDSFDGSELDENRWSNSYSFKALGDFSTADISVTNGHLEFTTNYSKGTVPENIRYNYDVTYAHSRAVGVASKNFTFTADVTLVGGDSYRHATLYIASWNGKKSGRDGVYISKVDSTSPASVTDFRGGKVELNADTVKVRMDYEAKRKLMSIYAKDATMSGTPWKLINSFGLDDPSDNAPDWGLTPASSFSLNIQFGAIPSDSSGSFTNVGSHQVFVDYVSFIQTASVDPSLIVYSTLGTDDAFNPSSITNVGWDSDYKRGLAWPFTVVSDSDRALNSVSLPLTRDFGSNLEISVWADQGSLDSTPKWTKIESLALNPIVKFWYEKYPDVLTFSSKLHPLLMRGRTYWLRLEPTKQSLTSSSGNCMYSWYCSKSGTTPKLAYLPVESGMKTLPEWTFSSEQYIAAFRVEGESVAETFTLTKETPYWDFKTPPGPAVKLSWGSVPGATSYQIWRDGVLIHPNTGTFTGRTFTNELGLTPGATHTFQIVAITPSGRLVSNTIPAIMPADPGASLAKPGGLALRAENSEWINGGPSVVLRWTDADGGNSYEIFRNGVSLGKVGAQNAYTDNVGLVSGSTVKYQIKSKNSAGITASNTVPVVLAKAPPKAVESFTFTYKDPTLTGTTPKKPSVVLNWTKAPGADLYDVFRNGVRIAKDLKGLTHTDAAGLAQGVTYSYYILAKGPGGETYSTDRSILMPAEAIASLGNFTLTYSPAYWDNRAPAGPAVAMTWSASKGATSYAVYRDNVRVASGITGLKFVNEKGLTPGGAYTFYVRAENGPVVKDSLPVTVIMPLGAPVGLKATALTSGSPITAMNISGATSGLFSIYVPDGIASLEIKSSGGRGDVALYLKDGTSPDPAKLRFIDSANTSGNNETITWSNPKPKTAYYILMQSASGFSGVTLTATLIPGAGRVATPRISPSSGPISGPTKIKIDCDTTDAQIFYTIGTSAPAPTKSSQLYNPDYPPEVAGTQKIQAIAIKDGLTQSLSASETYVPSAYRMDAQVLTPFQIVNLGWGGQASSSSYQVFRFEVPADQLTDKFMYGAAAVGFRLTGGLGLSISLGSVEVYAARGRIPYPGESDSIDGQLGKDNTLIFDLSSACAKADGSLAGTWYLWVQSKSITNANYNLMAYYMPIQLKSLGDSIANGKETWIVCHGRASQKEDMAALANALDAKSSNDQVLLVDWSAASAPDSLKLIDTFQLWPTKIFKNEGTDLSGTRFIVPMALKLQSWMNQKGIRGSDLRWIGHSWGAIVGYEFAKRQQYSFSGSATGSGKIARFIALDPATSGDKYAGIGKYVTTDLYPNHKSLRFPQLGFSGVGEKTWGFVSPSLGLQFGDADKAKTAHHSFVINFSNTPGAGNPLTTTSELAQHGGVVSVFTKLLEDNYITPNLRKIPPYFKIERWDASEFIWTTLKYNSGGNKSGFFTSLHSTFDFTGVIDATFFDNSEPTSLKSIDKLRFFGTDGNEKTVTDSAVSLPNIGVVEK